MHIHCFQEICKRYNSAEKGIVFYRRLLFKQACCQIATSHKHINKMIIQINEILYLQLKVNN